MSGTKDEPCEQPRAIIFWSLLTSPIFTLLSPLACHDRRIMTGQRRMAGMRIMTGLRSEEDERIMSKAISLQFVYNKGIAKRFKGFTNIFTSSSETQGQSTMAPEVRPKYLRWNISCCKWRRNWVDWSPKLDYKLLEIGKLVFVVVGLCRVPRVYLVGVVGEGVSPSSLILTLFQTENLSFSTPVFRLGSSCSKAGR